MSPKALVSPGTWAPPEEGPRRAVCSPSTPWRSWRWPTAGTAGAPVSTPAICHERGDRLRPGRAAGPGLRQGQACRRRGRARRGPVGGRAAAAPSRGAVHGPFAVRRLCAAREMARFHDPDEDPKALARDLTSLMSDQRRRFLGASGARSGRGRIRASTRRCCSAPRRARAPFGWRGPSRARKWRSRSAAPHGRCRRGVVPTVPIRTSGNRPWPWPWSSAARGPLADCVLVEPEFFDGGRPPLTRAGRTARRSTTICAASIRSPRWTTR